LPQSVPIHQSALATALGCSLGAEAAAIWRTHQTFGSQYRWRKGAATAPDY
jgi:hypothetical protein